MPLVEFNSQPTPTQLRRFASLGLPLALCVAALVVWRRGFPLSATAMVGIAALTWILGRFRPQWFRPLYIASAALSYPIAWLIGWLLLAAVYFLLIAPIGLVLRRVRRDPLARDFDREAQSYWVVRCERGDRQRYFRQY